MPASKADIEQVFPLLGHDGFEITSAEDVRYNCIAYACNDITRWWWPTNRHGTYWPATVPMEETVAAFEALFQTLGYRRCKSVRPQRTFERIAIFERAGIPTHAARQLQDGRWCSKLGRHEDIEHLLLHGLEQSQYGTVFIVMRRRRAGVKASLLTRLIEMLLG